MRNESTEVRRGKCYTKTVRSKTLVLVLLYKNNEQQGGVMLSKVTLTVVNFIVLP